MTSTPFVCELKFSTPLPSPYTDEDTINFVDGDTTAPRGNFTWSRSINKNIIYVPLPVDNYARGGYGYDLGFTQDNFILRVQTTDYAEYDKLIRLVKSNVGELSGTLRIGYNGTVHGASLVPAEYEVIVRYVNANGNDGEIITYDINMTVVSTDI